MTYGRMWNIYCTFMVEQNLELVAWQWGTDVDEVLEAVAMYEDGEAYE